MYHLKIFTATYMVTYSHSFKSLTITFKISKFKIFKKNIGNINLHFYIISLLASIFCYCELKKKDKLCHFLNKIEPRGGGWHFTLLALSWTIIISYIHLRYPNSSKAYKITLKFLTVKYQKGILLKYYYYFFLNFSSIKIFLLLQMRDREKGK